MLHRINSVFKQQSGLSFLQIFLALFDIELTLGVGGKLSIHQRKHESFAFEIAILLTTFDSQLIKNIL